MSRSRAVRVVLSMMFVPTLLTFSNYASASKPKTQLTMEDARKIALQKESGNVKSQELEKEKGRWIFSFDIERDKQIHEVGIDANTGEIIEDSVENPADEAKEKGK
ncbi:MAG TPA: PepSY domain-containing protein [Acidobacteriaceae bacterium]|jgi:uncharacterized membrane protein YkoI